MEEDKRHDYEKGYHDGRDGNYDSPSVVEMVVGALVPGIDPAGHSKDYDKGYKDGKSDNKRS